MMRDRHAAEVDLDALAAEIDDATGPVESALLAEIEAETTGRLLATYDLGRLS